MVIVSGTRLKDCNWEMTKYWTKDDSDNLDKSYITEQSLEIRKTGKSVIMRGKHQ